MLGSRKSNAPILEDRNVLAREREVYTSPLYYPNDMARKKKDSKGRENDITITSSTGDSVDTNADQLHELAESIQKKNRQAEMEGNGFDLPEPIQAISNAADELFELVDQKAVLMERLEKSKLNVMALMRAAGRKFYKHRDRTISIDGKETLKVEKPKHLHGDSGGEG